MKEKRIMAMDDRVRWLMTLLDLEIMTRRMELWGMKKQDCIKGVAEMEKQEDCEMEDQDLITEMDDLHQQQQEQGADEDEDESTGGGRGRLQGMSFTYKPMTRSPHLILGIPSEEETSWGIAPRWPQTYEFEPRMVVARKMENQDLITEMEDLHHINNKNKEQMKMNQQEEEEEEELQGMSFTFKPMHCLTSWRSLSEEYNHDCKDEGAMVNDDEVRMIIPSAPVMTAKEGREMVSAPPFYPYKHERLDNGFVYLIKQLDGQKEKDEAIKLKLIVKAGSICENEEQQSVAWVVQQLVFPHVLGGTNVHWSSRKLSHDDTTYVFSVNNMEDALKVVSQSNER
ncbi:hypothetical protein KY289_007236 [Solanum tuberosum]|nr:hypothetical protein KY289_007236 [Solanum tuberosum]